jgi:hypothetical protein
MCHPKKSRRTVKQYLTFFSIAQTGKKHEMLLLGAIFSQHYQGFFSTLAILCFDQVTNAVLSFRELN